MNANNLSPATIGTAIGVGISGLIMWYYVLPSRIRVRHQLIEWVSHTEMIESTMRSITLRRTTCTSSAKQERKRLQQLADADPAGHSAICSNCFAHGDEIVHSSKKT